MAKKVKAPGIYAPGSIILTENIIKNMDDPDEGLIMELSPGGETGMDKVAAKYGYSLEISTSDNMVTSRMMPLNKKTEEIDVSGETCPGPAIIVGEMLSGMPSGDRLMVKTLSSDTLDDIAMVARSMGSKIVEKGVIGDRNYVIIEKAEKIQADGAAALNKDSVLIVQSNGIGNAERAYATFIFSKVALSMGKKVIIFTLMDGVSLVKKGNAAIVKHPDFERLDKLMGDVVKAGATIYACELSAKFRGIKPSDLAEGVKMAGAATYLELLSDPGNVIVNF
ncbi:sulfur reduction protein DsrE [Methanocella sp. CWC-04]|uniref:Sulfur reduction protein DsrE n=1 Tax=Methanooceanicella nereidis TaxID=2052831 RepID=A0AAP2RDZ7_9EURY|nr:DsrE family protein [Methanocella sp. CWC-04]MCD1295599.1 sulfur reduction protein DsrE [Methanocella sp. CWC-04]